MMFVGYLYSRVRDAGWLATTALIGGIAAILANLVSISIVITVFVLRADISPEVARALVTLDGAGHLVQLLPLGVFVFFASAAALLTRALGRVLSWAGMVVGATSIVVLGANGLPGERRTLPLALPSRHPVDRRDQPSARIRPEPDTPAAGS